MTFLRYFFKKISEGVDLCVISGNVGGNLRHFFTTKVYHLQEFGKILTIKVDQVQELGTILKIHNDHMHLHFTICSIFDLCFAGIWDSADN